MLDDLLPDLSLCSCFGSELAAIGRHWLVDEAREDDQGEVRESFLDTLFELLVKPSAPMYLLGFADRP